MNNRIYNFSAGPAVLPLDVLNTVKENLLNYQGSGLGIMELSHRSSYFTEILKTAEANLRKLLNIGEEFAVLFLPSGATLQFSMIPMNLLAERQVANYIVSGYWAEKAFVEAKKFGTTHLAASSKENNHTAIPTEIKLSEGIPAYVHFTSNNTIYGTQFQKEPDVGSATLVCDASSDLLHKQLNLSRYGLIYASSQKNLGPAGITLVIIRKELLPRSPKNLPVLLDYNTYAENNSLYNTAPTFPIYVMGEMFKWLIKIGGLDAVEKLNRKKAAVLYDKIDSTEFYTGHAEMPSRSLMNVTFRLKDQKLEPNFVKEAEKAGLSGLEGHRAVGGVRASIYNPFPEEGVQALVAFMDEFERRNG